MRFHLLASASTAALGGALAFGLPAPAYAGLTCNASTSTCTDTMTLANSLTTFNLTTSLPYFTPQAGQKLTSVVVAEGASINSAGTLQNTSPGTAAFSFSGGLSLTTTPENTAPSGFTTLTQSTSLTPQTYKNVAAGQSRNYSAMGSLQNTAPTITGSNAQSFVGTGNFKVDVNGSAYNDLHVTGGNATYKITTYGDPYVSVTYNYVSTPVTTPAPEPASLALLGAGLTGTVVLRRRRKV